LSSTFERQAEARSADAARPSNTMTAPNATARAEDLRRAWGDPPGFAPPRPREPPRGRARIGSSGTIVRPVPEGQLRSPGPGSRALVGRARPIPDSPLRRRPARRNPQRAHQLANVIAVASTGRRSSLSNRREAWPVDQIHDCRKRTTTTRPPPRGGAGRHDSQADLTTHLDCPVTGGVRMEQRPKQDARLAEAARTRSAARERQAERADEIAGQQARLKREAEERREQREEQGESR